MSPAAPDIKVLETTTDGARRIRFGAPTHAAGVVAGQRVWESTLAFNPSGEYFNLHYSFSELPERAAPYQIAATFDRKEDARPPNKKSGARRN